MNFKITEINNGWLLSGRTGYHGDFDFTYRTVGEAISKMKSMIKTVERWT